MLPNLLDPITYILRIKDHITYKHAIMPCNISFSHFNCPISLTSYNLHWFSSLDLPNWQNWVASMVNRNTLYNWLYFFQQLPWCLLWAYLILWFLWTAFAREATVAILTVLSSFGSFLVVMRFLSSISPSLMYTKLWREYLALY